MIASLVSDPRFGADTDAAKISVQRYFEQWLASAENNVKATTFRRYSDLTRLHISPHLGAIRLAKLTPLDVEGLYKACLDKGLSPTTVSNIHALVHVALEQAVGWDLLTRNVADRVKRPRRATPEMKTWSLDQVGAVLASGDTTNLAALWRLALLTGMRRGEILGLRWQDIDLENGRLSVRRTLTRGKGGAWEFGTPKTAAGRRAIALPESATSALREHHQRQLERRRLLGDLWRDDDLVFTNHVGGPLHTNSLASEFEKLVALAQVPRIRFHDLRHTSATILLALGEHPKIVSERLGHSNVSITLDRYSHVTADMQRGTADRLEAHMQLASKTPA